MFESRAAPQKQHKISQNLLIRTFYQKTKSPVKYDDDDDDDNDDYNRPDIVILEKKQSKKHTVTTFTAPSLRSSRNIQT
jgi:hypothetical protein